MKTYGYARIGWDIDSKDTHAQNAILFEKGIKSHDIYTDQSLTTYSAFTMLLGVIKPRDKVVICHSTVLSRSPKTLIDLVVDLNKHGATIVDMDKSGQSLANYIEKMGTSEDKREMLVEVAKFAGFDDDLNHDGSTWSNENLGALRCWMAENSYMISSRGIDISSSSINYPCRFLNNRLRELGISPVIVRRSGDSRGINIFGISSEGAAA